MSREIPQKNPVLREDFGDKSLGQRAYEAILNGATCYVIMDFNKKGEDGKPLKCGKKAIGTLDFDSPIMRDTELLPVCSEDHLNLAKSQLIEEYNKNGWRMNLFGRNGIGRGV